MALLLIGPPGDGDDWRREMEALVPGIDFRLPTADECEALVAYMLSDLVAGQDERTR